MRVDYTVCSSKASNVVEEQWLKSGWKCVFRSGIDPEGSHNYPQVILHVWQKIETVEKSM